MAEFFIAYKKTCTNEGDTLSNDPACFYMRGIFLQYIL